MSEYRRLFVKEGTYFFTVVTYDRRPLLCEEPALIGLKAAFRYVMDKHPYRMDGLWEAKNIYGKMCVLTCAILDLKVIVALRAIFLV